MPAFGCGRVRVTPSSAFPDAIDEGRVIETPDVRVAVADDGTLDVGLAGAEYRGLLGVEDLGDRGDTYDFDPVADDPGATVTATSWRRWRHPSGLQGLRVERTLALPRGLDAGRERRTAESVPVTVSVEARVAAGVSRVDLAVDVENAARDHRLRLRFPTGCPTTTFHAATTFDVAARSTARRDDARWVHAAPATFAHQGWVRAGGLTVVAPGLPEAEVTADGTIVVTLLRAVGWLARFDLRSRPVPAGPAMPVPGAQCPGVLEARLSLCGDGEIAAAADAELGLWGLLGGPEPLLAPGVSLLALEPADLILSACKPAESGDGIVVRVLNAADAPRTAVLRPGFPVQAVSPVRLDETPADHPVTREGEAIRFDVPARALRSVCIT